ncbi:MAG TPA: purine-nucleoside phosphorylase [Chloroflexota bacterium]|nr:purine-nucleoside phosphorylase [Chloroflexota bacterium]
MAEQAAEAAELIRSRGAVAPRVGMILGSGLGHLADDVESSVVVPYSEIPHFPVSTVVGHPGELVIGTLGGVAVAAMRGRVHYYEGYSLHEVTFPVRVLRKLGADTLIVTNAAGGLNESFRTGDLMLLTDHLNIMGMAGQSPLLGPNDETLGLRFLDMLHAYDADLRRLAHEAAAQSGFQAQEGVYAMVGGPAFETMAEIRFLQTAGADAVGMSTIPEVIVARHGGMRVLGISAITDMAVGPGAVSEISHIEVLAAAEEIKPRLAAVVRGVLAALAA